MLETVSCLENIEYKWAERQIGDNSDGAHGLFFSEMVGVKMDLSLLLSLSSVSIVRLSAEGLERGE